MRIKRIHWPAAVLITIGLMLPTHAVLSCINTTAAATQDLNRVCSYCVYQGTGTNYYAAMTYNYTHIPTCNGTMYDALVTTDIQCGAYYSQTFIEGDMVASINATSYPFTGSCAFYWCSGTGSGTGTVVGEVPVLQGFVCAINP